MSCIFFFKRFENLSFYGNGCFTHVYFLLPQDDTPKFSLNLLHNHFFSRRKSTFWTLNDECDQSSRYIELLDIYDKAILDKFYTYNYKCFRFLEEIATGIGEFGEFSFEYRFLLNQIQLQNVVTEVQIKWNTISSFCIGNWYITVYLWGEWINYKSAYKYYSTMRRCHTQH